MLGGAYRPRAIDGLYIVHILSRHSLNRVCLKSVYRIKTRDNKKEKGREGKECKKRGDERKEMEEGDGAGIQISNFCVHYIS